MADEQALVLATRENYEMEHGIVGWSFRPTHIIYRKLAFHTAGGYYYYSNAPKRRPISDIHPSIRSIQDFARYIETNEVEWEQEPRKEGDEDGRIRELAIPHRVHAYVVIQLEAGFRYLFDNDYPAISFGTYDVDKPTADAYFGDVLHYDPRTKKLAPGFNSQCSIAVFSAIPRIPGSGTSKQKLNFNVVDARQEDVTIDPDIRYPGTGGDVDGGGTP